MLGHRIHTPSFAGLWIEMDTPMYFTISPFACSDVSVALYTTRTYVPTVDRTVNLHTVAGDSETNAKDQFRCVTKLWTCQSKGIPTGIQVEEVILFP